MDYLLRKVNSVTICFEKYAYLESHKCYFSFEYNFFLRDSNLEVRKGLFIKRDRLMRIIIGDERKLVLLIKCC